MGFQAIGLEWAPSAPRVGARLALRENQGCEPGTSNLKAELGLEAGARSELGREWFDPGTIRHSTAPLNQGPIGLTRSCSSFPSDYEDTQFSGQPIPFAYNFGMVANKVAENVLGTIGTICWTAQLIPQIWKSYRSKSTDGLSDWLVFLWAISGPLLAVYVIVQNLNVPIILQPHTFAFLCAVSWTQCLFYGRKWPLGRCLASCAAFLALMAGFEAGMIYAVKPSARKGDTVPLKIFSIASSVTIALGLLPQYWEIYRRKEVIGISIAFMAVDISGGAFLILSLAFNEKFDVFASIVYMVVIASHLFFFLVMDAAIVIAALILNPIARRKRAAQVSHPVPMVEAPTVSTGDTGGSNSPEKSDLESGGRLVVDGSLAQVPAKI